MFNLKKQHQELTALSDELCDIRHELREVQKYYLNHPEEHIPAFTDKSAAPMRFQQVETMIAKLDERFWRINSELTKRKYKIFNRK